jgi:hypothetical protein
MNWKKIVLLLAVFTVVFTLSCSTKTTTSTLPSTTINPSSTTPAATPSPWPGVPVYSDSGSPITISLNQTFAIVLPPAPLFGWGWQNNDLPAFTLLETKAVPGPGNQTDTYGPDAFLFKTVSQGSYQIILYVASKPPQQTVTFRIIVIP